MGTNNGAANLPPGSCNGLIWGATESKIEAMADVAMAIEGIADG